MGIDIEGGMIVGRHADELALPEDLVDEVSLYEWACDNGLDYFSQWYDCDDSGRVYGFTIKDEWKVSEIEILVEEVNKKAKEFEEITGVEAKLYGMQNVW